MYEYIYTKNDQQIQYFRVTVCVFMGTNENPDCTSEVFILLWIEFMMVTAQKSQFKK